MHPPVRQRIGLLAAALWWRLAGTLAPAMLDTANERLRPPWPVELHRILGSTASETITGDPAWPALVAAVNVSDWPPAYLLAAAACAGPLPTSRTTCGVRSPRYSSDSSRRFSTSCCNAAAAS